MKISQFTLLAALGTVCFRPVVAQQDACNGVYTDQSSCDANSTCTWCKCAALPSGCFEKVNAKKLPAGVYICDSSQGDDGAVTTGYNNFGYACAGAGADKFKFCDTKLSLDERLDDLVPRINNSVAGQQLTARESAELPGIGLPSYYWGTNAIHGLQNVECLKSGQCPTSFPAPCGLAASWNLSNVEEMGRVLGVELRAYLNTGAHNSLDTWSPTVNLNRDPRWGRNVESPGEDPLINGLYGTAYSKGVQYGSDDNYMQTVMTLKHWVAYSVESYDNVTRHTFNAKVSAFDLADSYFPAFKASIQNGGALGVMCSYNELNGKPTCGNPELTKTLREDWGFEGYITSDSDACGDIYRSHGYEPNGTLATRDCLAGGTDIDSGKTYVDYLSASVEDGTTDRKLVDAALRNTYRMRMKMGLFDPNVTSSLREIPESVVGSSENQVKSLVAARQTMVLLKNEKNTLPFAKGKSLAVMGRAVSDGKSILGNYVGPICKDKRFDCFDTLCEGFTKANSGGKTACYDDVNDIDGAAKAAKDAETVVLVIDNAYNGGGEGHDRYNISLEDHQQAYANAVVAAAAAAGRPLVLVMINGGAISIDTLKGTAPAILEAWMPGVHGAQAVAETVFGDSNPGGKMPVTMYPSNYVDQVDFFDMSMTAGPGRSYRYYKGEPLFSFGFGLSYTTFSMKVTKNTTSEIEVEVTNTGKVAGSEVVQGYMAPPARAPAGPGTAAVRGKLFGFERVELGPGETKTVKLKADDQAFSHVGADGHRRLYPGEHTITISRGHNDDIQLVVDRTTDVPEKVVIERFRKWW